MSVCDGVVSCGVNRLVICYNHLFDVVEFVMKFIEPTLELLHFAILISYHLPYLLCVCVCVSV